jgi:hypothetical protein
LLPALTVSGSVASPVKVKPFSPEGLSLGSFLRRGPLSIPSKFPSPGEPGSGRGLSAPVGPCEFLQGNIAVPVRSSGRRSPPCGGFRFPFGSRILPPLRASGTSRPSPETVKRNFSVSFRGSFGRSLRFRRTLEGKWVRLSLSRRPRASSFRLPGPRLRPVSILAELRPSSVRPRLRAASRFRWAALCHRRESVINRRVGQAGFTPSCLWITGISGINMG